MAYPPPDTRHNLLKSLCLRASEPSASSPSSSCPCPVSQLPGMLCPQGGPSPPNFVCPSAACSCQGTHPNSFKGRQVRALPAKCGGAGCTGAEPLWGWLPRPLASLRLRRCPVPSEFRCVGAVLSPFAARSLPGRSGREAQAPTKAPFLSLFQRRRRVPAPGPSRRSDRAPGGHDSIPGAGSGVSGPSQMLPLE